MAAKLLDDAVTAHLGANYNRAASLISAANLDEIRQWTEGLWGKRSPHVRPRIVADAPPLVSRAERVPMRMPSLAEQKRLQERDGFHCRFCGIPVIRKAVRERIRKFYPAIWGRKNLNQHAAFQAMWLQYDHVLPHSRGGDNSFGNLLITCAPCNYARMGFTLEELGLQDPRERGPVRSKWDGLERFV
jgi:5-methylcytosine-specific restriction endonuclease McrA